MSIFVTKAEKYASEDKKFVARTKARLFCKDADVNNDGVVTWEEFVAHVHHPILKELFEISNLHEQDALSIFNVIDDGSGACPVDLLVDELSRSDWPSRLKQSQ